MTDVKQLPEAFLKEMEQLLGDEYEAYIKSYEEAWKPGLRVNTLKIMPEEFKNLSHLELTPVDWTEKDFIMKTQNVLPDILLLCRSLLSSGAQCHGTSGCASGRTGR